MVRMSTTQISQQTTWQVMMMATLHNDNSGPAVIGELLRERGLTLALAESCTGGFISARITDIPGSSDYFKGGVVAYDNGVKEKVLKVDARDLSVYGAVSPQVARAMALGARNLLGTDIGLSVTGIAGPGGGSPEKPVGLVYLGLSTPEATVDLELRFSGSRSEIRMKTVREALEMLRQYLTAK